MPNINSKKREKVFLVTNDDGITAPGIRALIEVAINYGKVIVVAPDSPQSGMGHAVSIATPLRLTRSNVFEDLGVDAWQCSGTPVDCVKLANEIVLNDIPDYCLSGINHGSNASINVIYSGTMSAAMEAAIEGIPSAGFSSLDYSYEANMEVPKLVAKEIIENMISHRLPKHFLLNVNIPKVPIKEYKGIKICNQADGKWAESFIHRKDPRGEDYYWMTGHFENRDKAKKTDLIALDQKFASVVPITFDLTNYKVKDWITENWK